MAEYIEREALKALFFGCGYLGETIKTIIDTMPAADVAEVRHGGWTIKRDEYDCEYMVCSCCGECFYDGDNDTVDRTPKYCLECGAKMDGKGDME